MSGGITLRERTRELCHEFYRGLVQDPSLFENEDDFVPYVYDPAKVDALYDARRNQSDRVSFSVMLDGAVIGDVGLKHIDGREKTCELEICMQSDAVKNRGYGTQAVLLALDLAFDTLGMTRVDADVLVKNERSRRVLEKIGFRLAGQDGPFVHYALSAADRQK